jgi:hypothetical protein
VNPDPFAMLAAAVTASSQAWQRKAECRNLPTSWFYPEQGKSPDPRGLKACQQCSVRNECWAAGRDEQHGVWAGETVVVRKNGLPPIKHDTPGGYMAHLRRGETACADCKRAHSTYVQAHRNRTHKRPGRPIGGEWGVNLTGTFGRRRVMDEDDVA